MPQHWILWSNKSGESFKTTFLYQSQGCYASDKTAALVYDLVCGLKFGTQLDKVPDLLNFLNPDDWVSKVWQQPDGVQVYQVDKDFVVIFDENVCSRHSTAKEAKAAASSLLSELQVAHNQREQVWKNKLKTITITHRDDGIAYLPLCNKRTDDTKSLLSDESWRLINARNALVFLCNNQACIVVDGKRFDLARWLCNADIIDVVDHVNCHPLDNRLSKLQITDQLSNAQNSAPNGKSGLKGVHWKRNQWHVRISIRDTYWSANMPFAANQLEKAIKLYNLAALRQHRPGAFLHKIHRLSEYLKMLTNPETKERVDEFLAGKSRKKTSIYFGVHICTDQPGCFKSQVKTIGQHSTSVQKTLCGDQVGAQIQLAIFLDLWRLKLIGPEFTINFEWMRPWYVHQVKVLNKSNQENLIERAYQLLGGDDFAEEEKEHFEVTKQRQSLPPAPTLTDSSNSSSAQASTV